MRNYTYLLLALAIGLGWSCQRETLFVPSTPTPAGVRIKLIHSAPDAAPIDLYVNGQKISAGLPTGASSISAGTGTPTAITYGNTFPGSTASYAVVPAGQADYRLSSPASTTAGSATTVAAQTLSLTDGNYYSLITYGTGAQPQVTVLTDDFSAATDPSKFYVRFINIVSNGPAYDVALSSGQTIMTNVPYQSRSPFTAVDISNNASFVFRATGTTTNLGTLTFTGSTAGRVLTIIAQGLVGRTGAQAPRLISYVNR